MMEHKMLSSEECDGTLPICTVCGGTEGSLTTDCPGTHLAYRQNQSVRARLIDYRDGVWLNVNTNLLACQDCWDSGLYPMVVGNPEDTRCTADVYCDCSIGAALMAADPDSQ